MEHYKNLSLEDIEGEVWKPVVGYDGFYDVSNMGRVKSLERKNIMIDKNGMNHIKYTRTRILKQDKAIVGGYISLVLCKERHRKSRLVHILVAESFFGPHKLFVNHKNFNKLDNREDNLEYVTARENHRHYYSTQQNDGEFIGVYYISHKKIWRAILGVGNKSIQLGYFKDVKSAKDCYDEALKMIEVQGCSIQEVADRFAMQKFVDKGSKNKNAKLNEDQIEQIRSISINEKKSIAQISKQFNVSTSTVHRILRNKSWKHVKNIINEAQDSL